MKWLVRQKREPVEDTRARVPKGDVEGFARLERETGMKIVAWEHEHYSRGRSWGDWIVTLAPVNQTETQQA